MPKTIYKMKIGDYDEKWPEEGKPKQRKRIYDEKGAQLFAAVRKKRLLKS